MVRSAYRSFWRLHEDKTILTPGRYYFCGDDVPFAPFPTLRGSRNWDQEDTPAKRDREWGEWDGEQKWDAGTPPASPPLARLVGSRDCISNPASGIDGFPGNPVGGPFRTVCIGGVVYSFPSFCFVSFNRTYDGLFYEFVDDKQLYLVDAECEARYEGPAGIPDTIAILRVTAAPGGGLQTKFYLCENSPPAPPIVYTCGYCPFGVYATYRVTLADIIADPAHPEVEGLNGTWEIPYVASCQWRLTIGDFELVINRFEPLTVAFVVLHGATHIIDYQTASGDAGQCLDTLVIPYLTKNVAWVDDAPTSVTLEGVV